MSQIKVRSSVIDTSGEGDRQNFISMRYDGRIPQAEQDWARYGSHEAVALVHADLAVRTAFDMARKSVRTSRAWLETDKYAPEVKQAKFAEHRAETRRYLEHWVKCEAYAVKVEAAYQAFIAGAKAAQ